MTTRLHTLAADLDSRIQRADPQTQRQVALVAAGYGVSAAKLEDDRVMRLLTALQREEDSAILLFGAEGCVQELDELQWKLAAEIEEGGGDLVEQAKAFFQARAASAVVLAAANDPLVAAQEAVYEAAMTVDDPLDLWAELDELV